ncbi:MAG TPA: hypothetical protein VG406_22440 [Isosphaeraceae bacterium]|jgi:hypothetical protein|nr:hypothetical protein [Isosphaeraceae bacterium]
MSRTLAVQGVLLSFLAMAVVVAAGTLLASFATHAKGRCNLLESMILVASTAVIMAGARWVATASVEELFSGIMPVVFVATAVAFGGYGACIARWRRRSWLEGFWFGLILGPLGLLAEANVRDRH